VTVPQIRPSQDCLRPAALHLGIEARALIASERARPILGGRLACSLFERIRWPAGGAPERSWLGAGEMEGAHEALASLTATRPAPFDRPRLMGILNVTPDSFSDGGEHAGVEAAVAHGLRLAAEGADIVDVGGESTRPGAKEVPVAEELRRVLPVVERLAAAGVLVSIDTRKAAVMRAAVAAGARIINDVSGLAHDPASLEVAAASGAVVVLMHMQGTPETMNLAPRYRHGALEVLDALAARIEACAAAGIRHDRLIVDPGLCFGKHEPENLDLLRNLALFHGLGCPVLLGISRKGWTAVLEEGWPAKARLPATLAATLWALNQGVQLFRVHDVGAHRQLLTAWQALADLGSNDTSTGTAA
jgi:dihydropteroate synthase